MPAFYSGFVEPTRLMTILIINGARRIGIPDLIVSYYCLT